MSEEVKDDKSLKDYVEDKIISYMFKAKNFSKEEMDFVDDYCRKHYDNNRKLMILDLIRYKNDNTLFNLLNDKINFIYAEILNKLDNPDKKVEEKKEVHWKGFKKD